MSLCALSCATAYPQSNTASHSESGTSSPTAQPGSAQMVGQGDKQVLLVEFSGDARPFMDELNMLAKEAGLQLQSGALVIAGVPGDKAYETKFKLRTESLQSNIHFMLRLYASHDDGVYACLFDSIQAKALKCSGAFGASAGGSVSGDRVSQTYVIPHEGYKIGWHSTPNGLSPDGNYDQQALKIVLNSIRKALLKPAKK